MAHAAMDSMLAQLAESVSGARDLETLTRPMLQLLEAVTGLQSTYLTTVDEGRGVQRILYARNTGQMRIPEGLEVPWGDTLCKRALEEGRAYTDDVGACWGDSDAARALGIQTYMSQPVRTADTAITGRRASSWVARGPCITKSARAASAREARCIASACARSL